MNQRTKHFIMGWAVCFIVLTALLTLFDIAKDRLELWQIARTDTSHYFDYTSIEYIRSEDDFIVFASTSKYLQSYPVVWNDILRCPPDGYYSVQNANSDSPKVHDEYERVEWNYSTARPSEGAECVLESTITMDVQGVQKVKKIDTHFVMGEELNQ